MNIQKLLTHFAVVFVVTFAAAAIVTYLYSLIAYGGGVINWETTFLLAVILGITLPIHRAMSEK